MLLYACVDSSSNSIIPLCTHFLIVIPNIGNQKYFFGSRIQNSGLEWVHLVVQVGNRNVSTPLLPILSNPFREQILRQRPAAVTESQYKIDLPWSLFLLILAALNTCCIHILPPFSPIFLPLVNNPYPVQWERGVSSKWPSAQIWNFLAATALGEEQVLWG